MSVRLGVVVVALAACGGDAEKDPDDPGVPYHLRRVAQVGDHAFASGVYRTDPTHTGDPALIVFDLADPEHPRPIDHVGIGLVELRAQVGEHLVGVTGGRSTSGDIVPIEIVFYTVDGISVAEEQRVALPNSSGAMAASVTALADGHLVVGLESASTFVIDPASARIVATGSTPCRAIAEHGQRLLCFDGLALGTGTAARLRLDLTSASLVEESRVSIAELGLPREAHVVGDRIVVVDMVAGWVRFRDDGTGPLALEAVGKPGERGSTARVVDGTRLLYSTTDELRLTDAALATHATSPFTAKEIAALGNERYVIAAGDDGVVTYEVAGTALVELGGYFRTWIVVSGFEPAIREDEITP